jgi:D-alanyl-lipoteichoic acid acyltransferase DltB (MBOAT superfamily)
VYALAEAANNLAHAVLAALGLKSPPLHRTPIAACSLKEFWGERWNLPVSRWLRAHFFLPLARRRRPVLGVALAFLASAGLHAWTVGVALGGAAAASMAGYFAIQGFLMALEVRLGVARWTEPAGWAWTMLCVLAPSPLFLEPLLRVFAPAGAALV